MQITLEEPDFYLESLNRGLILDPSVFYTVDHVKSLSEAILAIRTQQVFLPSLLYEAIIGRGRTQWSTFRATMNLWLARYEELPEAWRESRSMVDLLNIQPTPEPDYDRVASWLAEKLETERVPRRLHTMVYEMTATSIQRSFPILACESSSFRIVEFLKRHFDAVVLEPGGRWVSRKRAKMQGLSSGLLTLLKVTGAALLFIAAAEATAATAGVGAGIILVIVVIDG